MSAIIYYSKIVADEIILYYDQDLTNPVISTDLFFNRNKDYIIYQSHSSNQGCDIQFSYFINGMVAVSYTHLTLPTKRIV